MSIEFQISGLVICVIFALFYVHKKRLNIYSQKIFFFTLSAMIILLVLDILSVVAITYQSVWPRLVVLALCKVYLVFLITCTCLALVYILVDVYGEQKHKKISKGLLIKTLLEAVVIFMLPIYIYADESAAYTYGPCTLAVYLFAGIDILTIIVVALVCKKKIYPRRWFAFMIWISLWVAAAAIQFFNSHILLVGFAAAMGMLILFVFLENPESNYSQQSGCFNTYALECYLKHLFENGRSFKVIGLFPEVYIENKARVAAIKRNKKVYLFESINKSFIIISEDEKEMETLKNYMIECKKNKDDVLFGTMVVCLEDGLIAGEDWRLPGLLRYWEKRMKASAVNNWVDVTKEMAEEYLNREKVLEEIRDSMAEDRVEVFFQPIYATAQKTFRSAEALMRIRRKDGSLLPPGVFIPVAEETGVIVDLGELLFEKVCLFLKHSEARKLGIEYVEINLSMVQCEQENLADSLLGIMNKHEIPSSWINLEITETASMNEKQLLLDNMEKMIAQELTFSLDDFGEGESNLMYIIDMPISMIKLDYQLTKASLVNIKARYAVEAVARMAHSMGLEIVAEGIESKEELDFMLEQKIDFIQGYYFSKPLPMDKFVLFLKQNKKNYAII